MATLNQIKRTAKRPYRRVGRGQSSTRGKQAGRGGKGQSARAGAKIRPELRDIIKKLPKRRGWGKNRGRTVVGTRPAPLALSTTRLEALFPEGGEVTPKLLVEKGIMSARAQRPVKLVAAAAVSKKFTLKGIGASKTARAAIEKAGGSVA